MLLLEILWKSCCCHGFQGKLGEASKFYYDEKLKMWREEGVDAIPDLSPPPPPPTSFPANMSPAASKGTSSEAPVPGGLFSMSSEATGPAAPAGPSPLPLGVMPSCCPVFEPTA